MNEEIIAVLSSPEDIDRVIHEPARLNIMLYLYVVEEANFVFLQRNTGLTRGNLSVHLQKLEQCGYVTINKKFVQRKPLTLVRLSKEGRKAFEEYRARILGILKLD